MAKGYTQTYGIDYQETFSPVAKLNIVRVLLSLAANLDWPLHQFDVKKLLPSWRSRRRSLHGHCTGYNTTEKAEVVYKLQQELYGLKQSPRAWFSI